MATVAPVADYASNVWMHACKAKGTQYLNRMQKQGAIAVTGAFRTVATAVAEAEAGIQPFHNYWKQKQKWKYGDQQAENVNQKSNCFKLKQLPSDLLSMQHAEHNVERDILPMYNDEGMAFMPYGVLGSGYFRTSAQRAAEKQDPETKREGRNIAFIDKPRKAIMADTLEDIAKARDTNLTSIALAWARSK
ncbi:norsolorinic acid reductase, putative [Talaromyces stipitatus ATCC 10500]|uniref:Norsolorinic acid reductase, putative n=1 Tax=Talaromyces stipitatus (strain ATCC 10500 / CBS 375.48 / QM 6759 / NRRL 1006) TaxID=441959 RepID=B8LZS3_TALSN|nr:norsolorinic acid reductase, putative [Talaromyces stipitatus ATCC 10500]EED20855.1 norsolorinic acid reductase, putative [Talaromyces stipitatus ATCC 10500]